MAIAFKDRVKTECTTIGTGDIVFGSTRHGFQDWSKVTNGETVYYCLLNVDEWEVGYGIKSTGGIQRNVLDSTTGSKISLTGSADVFLTYPADGVIAKDTNGNLILDGTITATSYFGDASTLDNLPTLESLGIENHDQIIVNTDGVISGDGGGLTNININLADNGLNNHDKITVDELGNLNANSISIDSSLGYPNNWAVTAQPTEFLVTQSGVTKGKISSDGKMIATAFVGDGSELTGINTSGEGTVADGCIYLNNQVITSDYVFPTGKNGMSAGPISVDGSVEVGDGTWTIVGEGGGSTLESLGIPNHDKVTVDVDGNVTVPNDLIVNGKGADCVFLGSATANNSASIEFTGLDSFKYKNYRVYVDCYVPVTNGKSLGMQLSSGGSFVTSNYYWQNFRWTTSGSGVIGNSSDDRIYLEAFGADNSANTANQGGSWVIDIIGSHQNTDLQKVVYQGYYQGSTMLGITGGGRKEPGTVDGIKFLASADNISTGRFYLYGFKG
jgi:hypothetical protein